MKKNIIILLIIFVMVVAGCKKNNNYGINFKKEYEALNGLENKIGKKHRVLNINDNNPYEKVDISVIAEKIDNKETFYLYIGDPMCPWCRSVLEKSIEVANKLNIEKIYYVDFWDDEGNEILRDKYEFKDGELVKTVEETDGYKKLLEACGDILRDYTLTNEDGETISVGEKRTYGPTFIYIEKGIGKKYVEGVSELQIDSREELTEEILKDEEKIFIEFFTN